MSCNMKGTIMSLFVLCGAVFILTLTQLVKGSPVSMAYRQKRQKLMDADKQTGLGANLSLNAQEQIVDKIILMEKQVLMDPSIYNRTIYDPSLSFHQSKANMEKTKLFKIIQSMPKGGILHIHDLAMGSIDWLVKNATYREHIYMCVDADNFIVFAAFGQLPKNPDCVWKTVKSQRESSGNVFKFDQMLKQNLSFLAVDPVAEYIDNDRAWDRFYKYFHQVMKIVYYIPVFKDFLWNALERIHSDNCQYVEYRGQLEGLFDLDNVERDAEFGTLMVREVMANFTQQHPDFIGGKVILTGYRHTIREKVLQEVKTSVMLRGKYPEFFLGYDLVGDEVWFNSLLYYLDALLYPSTLDPPFKLPYYFHAGETDWQETEVDYNLIDALLLNTSRIGHGFALSKHPHLAKLVYQRQIAVEVNPVSNQLLRLVTDLRNHPMTSLMADGLPVVISSDDPMVWEALPLSHDFFLALTTMSGKETGLAFLKQLAINSITYSGMSEKEKQRGMKLWQIKWDKFIKEQITLDVASSSLYFSHDNCSGCCYANRYVLDILTMYFYNRCLSSLTLFTPVED
ncbi:hypothetical protein EGW08_007135 [Elysia chlorotica]|uniref:adenosine deaminase n=1 Tax=Elysia chlorotica TaxID=188477 RepID=A0A433TU46_ELYCH|nr:hypothetical protein EGW08_007135 [Elysia chlorotica]